MSVIEQFIQNIIIASISTYLIIFYYSVCVCVCVCVRNLRLTMYKDKVESIKTEGSGVLLWIPGKTNLVDIL